jgi:hypothetical protein
MWRRYPLAAEREGHAPREEHDCDEDGQALLLTIHDVSRRMAQSVIRMLRSLACRKLQRFRLHA